MKKLFCTLVGILAVAMAHAQISFNYQNVKASDVIYSISKLTETTIVAPEINTYISLQAKDVSKAEALNILRVQLDVMKYSMLRDGNMYVVRQYDKNYQQNPNPTIVNQVLATRVFQIHSADAAAIASVIRDVTVTSVNQRNAILFRNFFISGKEGEVVLGEIPPTVSWEAYSNCLVARGTQAQIDEIERLIVIMDAGRNVVWTHKVYRLQYAQASTLAPLLTNVFSFIVNGQYGVSISAYTQGNALIVMYPQNYAMEFDNLITCLDAREVPRSSVSMFKIWNGNVISIGDILVQIGRKR